MAQSINNAEVLPFDTIYSRLSSALTYLYEESDRMELSAVSQDPQEAAAALAEKRFFRSHVLALQSLEKVLDAIKRFLLKVQKSFNDYNLLLGQFHPESETFKLIDVVEKFILRVQRFNTRHELSAPFFALDWYGRPNPEDRINKKPKDRIIDRRTE